MIIVLGTAGYDLNEQKYIITRLQSMVHHRKIPTFSLLISTLGLWLHKMLSRTSLHNVVYSVTKFEVATSNGLRGDAFTRKYII